MDIQKLLSIMIDKSASDLFITADLPPSIKVHGNVSPLSSTALSADLARKVVLGVMDEKQRQQFAEHKELNVAIADKTLGLFRCSAFYQRKQVGMVVRRIETTIPTVDELHLPAIIKDMATAKRGLSIFVGPTGAGKSTSLAAMIGHRNHNSRGHIISIEDPIEFVHEHRNCILTQREVGMDTESFDVALKNTLRQAPDVIMIGEVRSRETM